ncbi:L,D-transpeptidase family protein [Pseudocoprococcus catus]|uniref:L,D-transpeptidase family protein n=3 Tax=Coprococcus catus TaxID=116085 RepID=UPI001C8C0361|nr:L,D-transpeptidase family protein [Coprococcus catus]MBX9229473.1 L,D-transpeptidase family protein [Coprococcus catus]
MKKKIMAGMLVLMLVMGNVDSFSFADVSEAAVESESYEVISESESNGESTEQVESLQQRETENETEETQDDELENISDAFELQAPVVSAIPENLGFSLKWTKIENAVSYEVERSEDGVEWQLLADTDQIRYTDTGLQSGKEYFYRVRSMNEETQSDYSEIYSEIALEGPDKVQKITAESGECEITLKWKAVSKAQEYVLYMYDEESDDYLVVGKTKELSMKVKDLAPDQKHLFVVRARCKNNEKMVYSTASDEIEAECYLFKPEEAKKVKVTVGECEASLEWQAGKNAQGYTILMTDENGETKWLGSTKGTSYKVTDLKPGVYRYQIRSYRKIYNQNKYSSMTEPVEANVYLLQPEAAKNVNVTKGECEASLKWQAGKNAQGYTILMTDENGETKWLGSTKGTSYKVTDLKPGVYRYQIRSYRKIYNQNKYSNMTEPVEAKAYLLQPEEAKEVKAVSGEHSAVLNWKEGKNAQGYSIFLYDNSTHTYEWAGSTKQTSFTVGNLNANQSYSFCVRSYRKVYNQSAYSKMTNAVSAVPTEIIPAVPADVKAIAGDNCITVQWSAAKNATFYRVFAYNPTDGKLSYVAGTGGNRLKYTVNNLKNGQKYQYVVKSFRKSYDFTTESKVSKVVEATPVMTPPTPPTSLSVQYKSGNNNLSWPKVDKATGYYVYLYNYSTNEYEQLAKVTTNSYVHKGNGKKGKYKYMVKTYREDNGKTVVSKKGVEKLVFGADDITDVKKTVHPMYYSATINQPTRIYSSFSAKEKCGTVNAGERVTVIYRRSKRCTIKRKDGSVVYIKTSGLNFTAEHYTSKDYTTEQKEIFVNSQGYSSKTKYLIWLNTYTQRVNIFKGSKGEWKLIRNNTCATGAILTPTPPGIRSLYKKQRIHRYTNSHYDYLSKFQLENAFHTRVRYNSGAFVDSRLGRPLSHGCVRMKDNDAIYIYKNMPLDTTVVIY